MTKRWTLPVLGAIVLAICGLALAAEAAETQPVPSSVWYGYGWGYPMRWELERLPHFAVYPPVYYSQPVPRPYGYSPFAYPPYVMTPQPAPANPVTITNPYVPKSPKSEGDGSPIAQGPLTIRNPYVTQAASADSKRELR